MFLLIQNVYICLLMNSNIFVYIFYNHMNNYFRFLLIKLFMVVDLLIQRFL